MAVIRVDEENYDEMEARKLEAYQVVRHQIERETDLIHHRVSWLMSCEAFLFAANALLVAGLPTSTNQARPYQSDFEAMHGLLPVLGIIFAALVFCSVAAAILTTFSLRRHAHEYGVAGDRAIPRLARGWTWRHTFGASPAVVSPLVLIGGWVYLLASN